MRPITIALTFAIVVQLALTFILLFSPSAVGAFYGTNAYSQASFCGSNSSGQYYNVVSSTTLSIYAYKTSTVGSTNCKLYTIVDLADTFTNLGITDVTIDYSVNVVSGTCYGLFVYRVDSNRNVFTSSLFNNGTSNNTTTSISATSTTWNIASYGAGGYQNVGFATLNQSGTTANCSINVTAIRDQSGNNLLEFFDSTSGGGGGSTIINITDNGMTTSEWTCETTGSDTVCEATATTSVRAYDGPTYYEWLLVGGVIIFILLLGTWSRLSILRFKK